MARAFDALIEDELRRRNTPGMSPFDIPPPEPRRNINAIVDPAADTFIERFRPLSSDPAGDYQKEQRFQMQQKMQEIEKGVPVYRPGTPRFGDPSKVTSQAGTGTATDALPPGFSYVDAPAGLPPGFSYVDTPLEKRPGQQPAPVAPPVASQISPLSGVPLSADPAEQAREVAALQTGRRGRTEGPVTGAIANFLPEFGAGMAAGARRFMADTGRLQEPQNALPAALGGPMAPGIAAMRGGAALRAAINERGIAPGVDEAAAGRAVREGVAAGGSAVTPRMTLLDKEDSIGQMAAMARTGSPEDLTALARLRRVVPAERQGEVQGALVQRLGEGDAGGFDAGQFIKRYGDISDRAKNILFGQGGAGSLRQHLDSIEEVQRSPTWRGPSMKTVGLTAGAASAAGALTGVGGVVGPLAVLGTMLPVKAVAAALTSPATAASVAAWSRAYERAVRSGGNAALVSFNLATRNLNNTLGVDINPQDALGGARGQSLE